MIAWMTKPDAIFNEVLKRTFEDTLDEIRDSISALGPQENNTFFNDDIVYMFGGIVKLSSTLFYSKRFRKVRPCIRSVITHIKFYTGC